jgi:hypothetical protein
MKQTRAIRQPNKKAKKVVLMFLRSLFTNASSSNLGSLKGFSSSSSFSFLLFAIGRGKEFLFKGFSYFNFLNCTFVTIRNYLTINFIIFKKI